MPSLEKDTRLVMTILFIGTMSGVNVYFYAQYGHLLAFNAYSHATVFALMTIGGILVMKALFDLALNDRIEMMLLDRRISAYWTKRQKEEQQRMKARETMNQYRTAYQPATMPPPVYIPSPTVPATPSFLAEIEQ
jgi:hypothetical protein|tara:strand:+ start:6603 stop:7007 length:405 start_codon:yes stop_codon:yes gene_type:complete